MSDAQDVFISFTHIDDEPVVEGQPGWVTEFHRHLQTRLNKLWGKESRIWRDPSLQGNDVLLPAIESQLLRVRTLVSILSPRYVNSSWCQKEMVGFLKAAKSTGGFQVGDQVRWFKVLKTPLSCDNLPPDFPPELTDYFKNILGYSYFDIDPQSKRPREYSREFGPEAERLYHQKVYDLAWDLCALLKKIEAVPLPGSGEERKTIYLAAGTADMQSDRDKLKRELLERGHIVLGDASLPVVASQLTEVVRAALKQSDLSIHLVGSLYGFVPEGATDSAVALQNALAAEEAKAGRLRRIIKVPRDTSGMEERQAAFLRTLREDEALQLGAELIDGSIDQVKEIMLSLIQPPPKTEELAKRASPSGAGEHPPLVYLIGDQADMEAMDRVDDFLFERGVEVTRPSYEGAAEDLAKAHRRRLVECDAALIYYGSTSRDWVDMELMDLEQARGYGREKEYRRRAVCLAPPDDRGKQRFRTRAVDDVLRFDGVNPEPLAPFVEKVVVHN